MIPFFRQMRQKLTSQGKTGRYLTYALGEILLIVLGILIALQIQNWNETRQQELLFRAALEQVYNTVSTEIEQFQNSMTYLEEQTHTLEVILSHSDTIQPRHLIEGLYYVAAPLPPRTYESRRFGQDFPFNPEVRAHRELAGQISNYAVRLEMENPMMSHKAYDLLQEAGIPYPPVRGINAGMADESDYYNESDYQKLNRLMQGEVFVPALKTLDAGLFYEWYTYNSWKSDAQSLMKRIQAYYPGVRLLFKDVSLIGSSLNGWDIGDPRSSQDHPLIEIDLDRYIWQTEIYLKEGEVKFRCRESWAQNWGGSEFPAGQAQRDGANITIPKAGIYRVTLNLSEGTYNFELLDGD